MHSAHQLYLAQGPTSKQNPTPPTPAGKPSSPSRPPSAPPPAPQPPPGALPGRPPPSPAARRRPPPAPSPPAPRPQLPAAGHCPPRRPVPAPVSLPPGAAAGGAPPRPSLAVSLPTSRSPGAAAPCPAVWPSPSLPPGGGRGAGQRAAVGAHAPPSASRRRSVQARTPRPVLAPPLRLSRGGSVRRPIDGGSPFTAPGQQHANTSPSSSTPLAAAFCLLLSFSLGLVKLGSFG